MAVTVFTPTYNRAELLVNLYRSLVIQTSLDFVWLIVDDGSTDNTRELISEFIEAGKIKIRYIYQLNSGKHVAHNCALEHCETDLFFCVDSDDVLTPDAINEIIKTDCSNAQEGLLGFYFRKGHMDGTVAGASVNLDGKRIGLTELYTRYGFKGEMAIVLKTEMVRNYRFPIFEDERFIPESVFYEMIDAAGRMLFVEKVIYLFEYLESGYSMNIHKVRAENPKGTALALYSNSEHMPFLLPALKKRSQYYAWLYVMKLEGFDEMESRFTVFTRVICKILRFHYVRLFKQLY